MQVVARQQNYLAGPDNGTLSTLTFDANAKRAFDDIVINNQMRRLRAGAQCSGETRAAMHQGAKKSACRNTPPVKCATLKTSDNASIPAF